MGCPLRALVIFLSRRNVRVLGGILPPARPLSPLEEEEGGPPWDGAGEGKVVPTSRVRLLVPLLMTSRSPEEKQERRGGGRTKGEKEGRRRSRRGEEEEGEERERKRGGGAVEEGRRGAQKPT